MINNAKIVHDILAIQQWMSKMENIVQQVQDIEDVVGPSKPPPNEAAHDLNNDGTTIKIIFAPMFSLDDNNLDDI